METKKACNEVCTDATAVALAHRAADIGTAVHRMTECLDRGQPVDAGPWEPDIEAYVNTLIDAGLAVLDGHIECRLVCDELEVAGSADRILYRIADGANLIADIKTGETVDYGGLGWAAQLAAYAHGALYDVEAGERLSTPALDRTTGIIIHLPAGRGVCTLYEIDLVAGYRAAQLANEIRSVRREARRWIQPIAATSSATSTPTPTALPVPVGVGDRRTQLLERYSRLDPSRQIAFRARGVDRDNLDAVQAALEEIEPVAVDEKRLGTPEVAELNERLMTITPEQRTLLNDLARQALKGPGQPIVFRYEPFERNVAICRALLNCIDAGYDETQIRYLVEALFTDDLQPTFTTGAALGVLTFAEAVRFDEMARTANP